jgi:hypothetical protein
MTSRLDAVLRAGHAYQQEVETGAIGKLGKAKSAPKVQPGSKMGQRGPSAPLNKAKTAKDLKADKKVAEKAAKEAEKTAKKNAKLQKAGKSVVAMKKVDKTKPAVAPTPAPAPSPAPAAKKKPGLKAAGAAALATTKPKPAAGSLADKIVARETKPAQVADMGAYQREVKAYETKRDTQLKELKAAQANAEKCVANRKQALAEYEKDSTTGADKVIQSLLQELKTKIDLLNKLQYQSTNDGDAKSQCEKQKQSIEDELKARIKALEEDLKEAKANNARESQEADNDLKAKLAEEEAKHAADNAESAQSIAEWTKKYDDVKDQLDKCGDAEKTKIAEMQKANREAVEAYDALNKKVCEMLKQFELPSDTTEV